VITTNRRNGTRQGSRTTVTRRVAIYTRKSTDEGLDQENNSLESQRELVEAYIASQRAEGWSALPGRYDDGGFSGGDTDRPAFQRLIQDVEAGKVDIVACYKLDRLSRSLLDFLRIMEFFEKHEVAFISVTQALLTRLGEVDGRLQEASARVEEIRGELASLEDQVINEQDLKKALGEFGPVWDELFPAERARVMRLLVERVAYHGKGGKVELVFRAGGIRSLGKGQDTHIA